MATSYTSVINASKFTDNEKKGTGLPNRALVLNGSDEGRVINVNQIDWGASVILGEAMTHGTTQRVFEILEEKIKSNTDPTEIWETYDEELTEEPNE